MNQLNKEIKIQKWVVVIFIPLLIAFSSFFYSFIKDNEIVRKSVEYNTAQIKETKEDIKNLENQKADKEMIQLIFSNINEINKKLDNYILNDSNNDK